MKNLSLKYKVLLTIVLSLLILSITLILTVVINREEKRISTYTYLVSKQSSIIVQYSRDFFYFQNTGDLTQINESIQTYERIQDLLLNGGDLNNTQEQIKVERVDDPQIREEIHTSTKRWRKLKNSIVPLIKKEKLTSKDYKAFIQQTSKLEAQTQALLKKLHQELQEKLNFLSNFIIGAIATYILIGLIFFRYIKSNQLTLIERITEAAIALSKGEFKKVVETGAKDELGKLATCINQTQGTIEKLKRTNELLEEEIVERERIQKELIEKEKMAHMGILASGVAHEIRNPLTTIIGATDIIESELEELNILKTEEVEKFLYRPLKMIKEHGHRINEITTLISIGKSKDRTFFSPSNFIETYLKNKVPGYIMIQKQIITEEVYACQSVYESVFEEIIKNSVFYLLESITPILKIECSIEENYLKITIANNGEQIAEDDLEKVFTPFFTTKPTNKGKGLGLSKCYNLLFQIGGKIQLDHSTEDETSFTFYIPIYK